MFEVCSRRVEFHSEVLLVILDKYLGFLILVVLTGKNEYHDILN